MTYRKFKADYLFDGYKLLNGRQVLITDSDGTVQEIVEENDAGEDVEELTGLISPGFINCHCHLELSHLKGLIPMKTGLVSFVLSIVGRRKTDAEEILATISEAETDMLTEGIVAVGDICNTADTLNQKAAGRLAYYDFIELAGWLPAQAESRFAAGMVLAERFRQTQTDAHHISVNPHAPYSVSAPLWDFLQTGFSQKTITIHNQETAGEDAFFISKQGSLAGLYTEMKIDNSHFQAAGISSLSYYLHRFKAAKNILLVHNTFTSPADTAAAIAFSPDLFFCVCPNANLYIEDRLPDIPAMVKAGGHLVIGTDSLASNAQLSVLEEMKTIKKHFPETETVRLLRWATSNGARALQFENQLGDFKQGKKPGIVLIRYRGKDPINQHSTCHRLL